MRKLDQPSAITTESPINEQRFYRFLGIIDTLTHWLGMSEAQIIHLDFLASLPEHTFGHDLAAFYQREKLTPFTTGPRRKQLHDATHVLTGYGTDLVGEAELQAFLLGISFTPLNALLKRQTVRRIRQLDLLSAAALEERLNAAYQRGQRSRFDPNTWPVERQWYLPAPQVRRIYGL
ncbi:Coq4 family protein [Thermosynechococcaceae cyanobacterium Okahandja]